MSVNQKSGHGTLVSVQLTPGGAFTDIAEQGDITAPTLERNEFDATTQNEEIDSYVLGVARRGLFNIALNFIPDDATQDHLTGMQKLFFDNTITGFKITFPQITPALEWIMSGQVKAFNIGAPVDGKLTADCSIRLSGLMSIGGVVIGA